MTKIGTCEICNREVPGGLTFRWDSEVYRYAKCYHGKMLCPQCTSWLKEKRDKGQMFEELNMAQLDQVLKGE